MRQEVGIELSCLTPLRRSGLASDFHMRVTISTCIVSTRRFIIPNWEADAKPVVKGRIQSCRCESKNEAQVRSHNPRQLPDRQRCRCHASLLAAPARILPRSYPLPSRNLTFLFLPHMYIPYTLA